MLTRPFPRQKQPSKCRKIGFVDSITIRDGGSDMLARVAPYLVAAVLAPASAFRIPVASPLRRSGSARRAASLSPSSSCADVSAEPSSVGECASAEASEKILNADKGLRGLRGGEASYDNVADFVWSRFDSPSPIMGSAKATKDACPTSEPRLRGEEVAAAEKQSAAETQPSKKKDWSIALHGGAGVLVIKGSPQEQEYHEKLQSFLRAGAAILAAGGTSEEAVEAVVVLFEDCEMFNCGHGASLTMLGRVEMDAAMMSGDGVHTRAGAVSSALHIRNPIKAARLLMDEERFVLLTADGADTYARDHDLAMEDNEYFVTDWRWNLHIEHMPDTKLATKQDQARKLRIAVASHQAEIAVDAQEAELALDLEIERELEREIERASSPIGTERAAPPIELKFGTVGCVALDRNGNLCAGPSTLSPEP